MSWVGVKNLARAVLVSRDKDEIKDEAWSTSWLSVYLVSASFLKTESFDMVICTCLSAGVVRYCVRSLSDLVAKSLCRSMDHL